MKFDYVIGNPPYNANMYIDFIQMAYYHSKKASSFIVPAKWLNLTTFSDKTWWLLKYIRKVVYYRNTIDVFNIGEPDGIVYYLMTKEAGDTYELKGRDSLDKEYEFDWVTYPTGKIGEFWLCNNRLRGIFEKLKNFPSYKDYLLSDKHLLARDYYVNNQNLLHTDRGIDDVPIAISVANTDDIKYIARKDMYHNDYIEKYKVTSSAMEILAHNFSDFNVGALDKGVGFYGSASMLGAFDTAIERDNCFDYLRSHFVQIMTSLCIASSVMTADLFRLLPMLDFRYHWDFCSDDYLDDKGVTHKSLNRYLGLTDEEVDYIQNLGYGCSRY